MSNEITRENVQEILDRNSAAAKQKEAALNEQERKLRLHINDNHATKTASKAQLAQRKAKEEAEALEKRQQKRTDRAMEAAECSAWYRFMFGAFSPILIAGPVISLAGGSPVTFLAALLMAAYTVMVIVFIIKAFFPITRIIARFANTCVEAYAEYKEIIHDCINLIKRKDMTIHG